MEETVIPSLSFPQIRRSLSRWKQKKQDGFTGLRFLWFSNFFFFKIRLLMEEKNFLS